MRTLKENSESSAFPVNEAEYQHPCGLTKREYFAGLAMQGCVAASYSKNETSLSYGDIAAESVRAADYLLAELQKEL